MPFFQTSKDSFSTPQETTPRTKFELRISNEEKNRTHDDAHEGIFDNTFDDLYSDSSCSPSDPSSPAHDFAETLDLFQDPRFLPTSALDSFWAAALDQNFKEQRYQQLQKEKEEEAEKQRQARVEQEKEQERLQKEQQRLSAEQSFCLAPHPDLQIGKLVPTQLYRITAPDGTQSFVTPVLALSSLPLPLTPPTAEKKIKKEPAVRKPRQPLTEVDGVTELKKSFYPRVKQRRGRKRKYVEQNPDPPSYEDEVVLGIYSRKERTMKIQRYRSKRSTRCFKKKILYACRKNFANKRPRVGGRFIKLEQQEAK